MSEGMEIGGVSLRHLAQTVGTPFFIYDEAMVENHLHTFRECLSHPELETQVVYAGKAFLCGKMARLVRDAGCGLDVVSGGELAVALHAGMPAERIVFHGNNKTPAELTAALKAGVGLIVLDNAPECAALAALAEQLQCHANVLLRVNPGVEAHTHEYIVTAHVDSKFGVSAADTKGWETILQTVEASPWLHFCGIHAHIGSQIFEAQAFVAEIEALASLTKEMQEKGYSVRVWDLGGGFAARYTEEDAPIPIPLVCETILKACTQQKAAFSLDVQKVMIEPGRSIVGEAGTTVYTVGWFKSTPGKEYLFVDGGMADNIRPALYQAKYDCTAVDRPDAPAQKVYTIAGKCCESGDILIEQAHLPEMKTGDLLAIHTTGAYCYSMSSNYNHLGRPPVIFAKDGKAELVLRREMPQDFMHLECQEALR